MKKAGAFCKSTLVALAMIEIVVPQARLLAGDQRFGSDRPVKVLADNTVLDIRLGKDNTFTGRVLDHSGAPVKSAHVSITQGKSVVADSVTNQKGEFAVANMKTGTYRVSSGNTEGVYRLWSDRVAPPSSKSVGLLVMGENGTRGQYGADGTGGLLLVTGTLVALGLSTAALVIAINNKNNSNGASSTATPTIVPVSP